MPEGSPARQIFDARRAPEREARRARRRLDDPANPDDGAPAAVVFEGDGGGWTAPAAAIGGAVLLHAGLIGLAVAFYDAGPDASAEPPPIDPDQIQHVVDLERQPPPEPKPEREPPEPESTPEPRPTDPPDPSDPEPTPTESDSPSEPSQSSDDPPESGPSQSMSSSDQQPPKKSSDNPAAKAGDVMDTKSATGMVDFTESAGSGTQYAGGVTAPSGTSDEAVRDESAEGGGAGQGAGDGSRPVGLDRTEWDCPWPEEARDLSVDEQVVVLRAQVRADGTPTDVTIVSDPGFGFGEAARECAQSHTFEPARGPDGEPRPARSPPIRIRFTR
ncbi:MAG: energy transducer TonB [Bradymonadaceae bacterium]